MVGVNVWILQFLLGLLKIIGIVLLAIICIVLLLVLLILFGAIRYQVEGSAKNRESTGQVLLETLHINAKVSWLNPLFRVFVQVKGKKVAYQVKVFGFCVLDSEQPKKPKKPKKKKQKEPKATATSSTSVENDAQTLQENSCLDSGSNEQNIQSVSMQIPQRETGLEDTVSENQDTEPVEVQSEQDAVEPLQTNQTEETKQITDVLQDSNCTAQASVKDEPLGNKKKAKKAKKKDKNKAQDSTEEAGEKKKFSFTELKEKLTKLKEKKDLIMEFLQEETTKLTVAGTFRTIKKVILHILPVSIRGNIIYGSGDPASTGKAFAVLGILYAKYGESLTVLADFEEKRLEADVQIKGRIRLGTMAWYFIAFVLKKETRAFIKRCMQLIKKLK